MTNYWKGTRQTTGKVQQDKLLERYKTNYYKSTTRQTTGKVQQDILLDVRYFWKILTCGLVSYFGSFAFENK